MSVVIEWWIKFAFCNCYIFVTSGENGFFFEQLRERGHSTRITLYFSEILMHRTALIDSSPPKIKFEL